MYCCDYCGGFNIKVIPGVMKLHRHMQADIGYCEACYATLGNAHCPICGGRKQMPKPFSVNVAGILLDSGGCPDCQIPERKLNVRQTSFQPRSDLLTTLK